jgi:hypothetical protein
MKTKIIFSIILALHLVANAQEPYYGELNLTKTYFYFDTLTLDTSLQRFDISKKTSFMASAAIYNDTASYPKPWLSQNFGQVKYNDVPLSYSEMLWNYQDTIERKENPQQKWEFTGPESSRNFSVTLSGNLPNIESKHIIPDYLHVSTGITIDYGNVSNADSVQIIIYDYTKTDQMPLSKTFAASTTSATISSADLAPFINGNPNVIVSFIREVLIAVNDKNYMYRKRYNIVRPVAVVE